MLFAYWFDTNDVSFPIGLLLYWAASPMGFLFADLLFELWPIDVIKRYWIDKSASVFIFSKVTSDLEKKPRLLGLHIWYGI